jgi:leader peptidase (prepilin peptidase)/N-methyltransferase
MAIALWAALGLGIGGALVPVVHRLADASSRRRLVLSAFVLIPVTGLLFGLLAWRVHPAGVVVGDSVVAAVGAPLAAIDLAEQRLPQALLIPAYPVVITALAAATIQQHDGRALVRSVLGMVILFLFFLILALATGDVGAGDVRLAGLLGLVLAWRSWASLLAGTLVGLATAAVAAAVLITTGRGSLRTPIPLGPALIAGTLTAVLVPLG